MSTQSSNEGPGNGGNQGQPPPPPVRVVRPQTEEETRAIMSIMRGHMLCHHFALITELPSWKDIVEMVIPPPRDLPRGGGT